MLHRVTPVRTDVSEELTRPTRLNFSEDAILHSHRRENLKPYINLLEFPKSANCKFCILVICQNGSSYIL
jgi:hypothetical protein